MSKCCTLRVYSKILLTVMFKKSSYILSLDIFLIGVETTWIHMPVKSMPLVNLSEMFWGLLYGSDQIRYCNVTKTKSIYSGNYTKNAMAARAAQSPSPHNNLYHVHNISSTHLIPWKYMMNSFHECMIKEGTQLCFQCFFLRFIQIYYDF